MSDNSTLSIIEKELYQLAESYAIPEEMIPQLIGLLKQFPDSSNRKSKKGLKEGLKLQIKNLKNQGILE